MTTDNRQDQPTPFLPGDYLSVPQWCGGDTEDAPFGVCSWVAFGNWQALFTGQVMEAGEIQSAARTMTGFNARDPASDHGIAIATMLADVMRDGWPGDPTFKPVSWRATDDLDATVARYWCALAWLRLPMLDGEWCFSDDAPRAGIQGTGPHAALVVDADADQVVFVTWGRLEAVSRSWWDDYVGGCFEVVHPVWAARMVADGRPLS